MASRVLRGIIMGSPGSGKGTQIKRIKESAAIQHISSGDVLRDNIHRRTPVGLAVQSTMAEGRLVDDRIVARLVLDRVAALINDTFILDGFPRTVEQAKSLDQFLESNRAALDVVINLDVPWQTIVERIADRWIHAPSGRTYNINYNPPKTAGLDDVTGEKLVKREDDSIQVVMNRLKQYNEMTLPLLEYYDSKGVLHNFKGSTSDEITPHVQSTLARFQ